MGDQVDFGEARPGVILVSKGAHGNGLLEQCAGLGVGDLEKLRERSLLREFREYVEGRGRLKVFRGEAVRAGFRDAWRRRDYAVIVAVARRLPERVLQEDADLLMYYDNTLMRMGVE